LFQLLQTLIFEHGLTGQYKDKEPKDKKKNTPKKRKEEEDGRKTPPQDDRGRVDAKKTPTRRGSSLPSKTKPQQPQQVGGTATPRRSSQRYQNTRPVAAPVDQYGYGYNPYYSSYPTVYYPYQGYQNYMMPMPLPNPQSFTSQSLTIPVVMAYLRSQVEFYFSVDNLVKDLYLRKNMSESGWVEGTIVTGFRRVRGWMDHLAALENRELDESWALERLVSALQDSGVVEIEEVQVPRFRTPTWANWIIPSGSTSPTDLTVSREASDSLAEKSVLQKPVVEEPIVEKPTAVEKRVVENPAVEERIVEKRASEKPSEKPIEKQKPTEKQSKEKLTESSPEKRRKEVTNSIRGLEIKETWATTLQKSPKSQKTWSEHDAPMDYSQAPSFSKPMVKDGEKEEGEKEGEKDDEGWQMVGAPKRKK
jgi:hypothetical protein